MITEESFVNAIAADRDDDAAWLVYADWLEEHVDDRSEFVRLTLATKYLSADHACRPMIDDKLSRLAKELDRKWQGVLLPREMEIQGRACWCYRSNGSVLRNTNLQLHGERQDMQGTQWRILLESIEATLADGREEFAPLREMSTQQRAELETLPCAIGKLTKIHSLILYGSHLSRIPPEIGQMENLERFAPYTSYRLHWFPYEITRCQKLHDSTVSTRAIYGNFKYRSPFPRLIPWRERARESPGFIDLYESRLAAHATRNCSVCDRPFSDEQQYRVWISCRVATDVLPLLVNACSQSCVDSLPPGAKDHVRHPHVGGPDIEQPASEY